MPTILVEANLGSAVALVNSDLPKLRSLYAMEDLLCVLVT